MNADNLIKTALAWAELVRVKHCLFAFLGVFIGASVHSGGLVVGLVVLKTAVGVLMLVAAGNIFNDYIDCLQDKLYNPKRPLPSGRVSKSDAAMAALLLFLGSIGLAKNTSDEMFYAIIFSAAVILVYAKYSKSTVLISNLAMSYFSAAVFLIGVVAVEPDALFRFSFVWIFAACMGMLTFARELVEDMHSMEADALEYTNTLPMKIGSIGVKGLAFVFAGVSVLITTIPFTTDWIIHYGVYGVFIFLADAVVLFSFTQHPAEGNRTMAVSQVLVIFAFFFGAIYL
ncbi:MAG: hypothetical protein MSIBF_01760 [Candidatus Altiarchaeales archaeon IMC4]|nr:MAG: hypothetical protein MSIBF_01760 [Candidatus Altiarchaeales archaeon IMC4]